MKEEYKGYEIELNEGWNDKISFSILQNSVEVKDEMKSTALCKEWIDKQLKRKFKRVLLIKVGSDYSGAKRSQNRRIVAGEATSIANIDECWATFEGDRSKNACKDLIIDTPENRKILELAISKINKSESLEEEYDSLKKTTTRLTPDMMEIK